MIDLASFATTPATVKLALVVESAIENFLINATVEESIVGTVILGEARKHLDRVQANPGNRPYRD